MLGLTILDNKSTQQEIPTIKNPKPIFDNDINGGIQLELTAGTSFAPDDEGNMFEGFTIQLVNINDANGKATQASTLAGTPTQIFNNEFATNASNLPARPGVPVTGIGLSGYGASMFSEWENKEALFAQTSQAQFKCGYRPHQPRGCSGEKYVVSLGNTGGENHYAVPAGQWICGPN